MFIYRATNLSNGKQYIGLTRGTVKGRWAGHCADARNGSSRLLAKAIRKYGASNFDVVGIDFAENYAQLLHKEKFWIKESDSVAPHGYNLTTGGDAPEFSEESKRTMSKSALRRFSDANERALQSKRIRNSWSGSPKSMVDAVTENSRKTAVVRSIKMKSVWASAERAAKITEAQRNGWEKSDRKLASEAAKLRWKNGNYASKRIAVESSDGLMFSSISACAAYYGVAASHVNKYRDSKLQIVAGVIITTTGKPIGTVQE